MIRGRGRGKISVSPFKPRHPTGKWDVVIAQVVIVGRPNVGKSSLFNWMAGRRIAIVDPTPGVTRDRLMAPVKVGERYFEIVDTGGIGIVDSQDLTAEVEHQIQTAIDQADLILFVVDVRSGPM